MKVSIYNNINPLDSSEDELINESVYLKSLIRNIESSITDEEESLAACIKRLQKVDRTLKNFILHRHTLMLAGDLKDDFDTIEYTGVINE